MTAPVSAASSNRRALIMLAVGGGVLLLFFLGTQVFGGGGGDDTSAPITAPTRAGQGTTTSTAPVTPGAQTPPAETSEVFSAKNPFTPLVSTGGGGTGGTSGGGTGGTTGGSTGGGTSGGTGTTGGTSGGTTGGSTATTVPASTGGTTGGTTGGGQEPRRSTRVALLDIYADGGRQVANVRVNDTVYEAVAPGDEFATSFKLVALEGQCGTFLFGDDRFRLCKGEEVLK